MNRKSGFLTFLLGVMLSVGSGTYGGALTFKAGLTDSSITYKHDVEEAVGGVDFDSRALAVSAAYPGYQVVDTTRSGTGNLDSRVRGSLGHNTHFFRGTGIIQPGTLLTPVDTNDDSTSFSTLRTKFKLRWSGTIGPPILSTFVIPLLIEVGAGGEAIAKTMLDWGKVPTGADTVNDFTSTRTQFNTVKNCGQGAHLTYLAANPAAFNTISVGSSDDYVVMCNVKISVENATKPSGLGLDPAAATVHWRFDHDGGGPSAINSSRVSSPNAPSYADPHLRFAGTCVGGGEEPITITPSFTYEVFAKAPQTTWDENGLLGSRLGSRLGANGAILQAITGTSRVEAFVLDASGAGASPIASFDVSSLTDRVRSGPADITDFHHYGIRHEQSLATTRPT